MIHQEDGACVYRSSTLIHEMVNVCDVAQWFRDATSDRRLEALCRLLDCCMPLELQFLNTYLHELLRPNVVANQNSDPNMPELHEITDSTCRRQLCLILTRLKSASVLAGCIYNILIQYNFSEFFSRVMVMEEELVDEILLLFTLAANHPAMTFSQRRNLHQRLIDLRETIEKSFKCCHGTDICSQHNQEYICKPLEKTSAEEVTNSNGQQLTVETPRSTLNMQPMESAERKDVPASKSTFEVHMKDLRVVRTQQRSFDKKYEYIFEVTWSNGKVVRIHRAYGELFDFQCKLRRRYSKEISKMTERKVIPYLPARRPIKLCKGSQVLPDITHYVREFTKLPDKLLHSESVEHFFSDGTEKNLDDKQHHSKTKQSSNHEKSDRTNITCKHADVPRVNVDINSDKGSESIKNHSPKGKNSSSFSGKKFNSSFQTSGKLESKKRSPVNPKIKTNDTATSSKDRRKTSMQHHQPKTILKSPNTSSTKTPSLDKTVNEGIKTDSFLPTRNNIGTDRAGAEKTIYEDQYLKNNIDASNNKDTLATELNPSTDTVLVNVTDSPTSTSSVVVKEETLSIASTDLSVVSLQSPNSLRPETLPGFDASIMKSETKLSSKSTSPASSAMTSSTVAPSEITSFESLPTVSSSPLTTSTTSSPAPASTTATSFAVTSPNSLATSSSALTSKEAVSPTLTSSTAILSTWTSTISSISNTTTLTPTIISPTVDTNTPLTRPAVTPLSISTPPQAPLTVTLPLLSSPCASCSISNLSSSEDSVRSSSSRTPHSSPAILNTPDDTKEHENDKDGKFSVDKHLFNGSMYTPLRKCRSLDSKLCWCDDYENGTSVDEVLDHFCDDTGTKAKKFVEKLRSKTTMDTLRSTSGKNGYTRHHHNISQYGLLIVPNGFNHLSSSDPRSPYNNYDHHLADQHYEEPSFDDDLMSPDEKTNDKNCNYIFQNGGHNQTLDFNSNNKSYEYAYTASLNTKSNGFSKPFCYNCGACGHHGSECSGTEVESSIV